MTDLLEFDAPTGTPVGNGSDQDRRMVLRFTKSAEYVAEVGAAFISLEPVGSGSAHRSTDPQNIFLPRCSIALITTFAPEPYEVKKPIPVSIYSSEDEYNASFFDANIHTSGDNEQEAFENLKSLILDMYDGLISRRVEDLGPGPMQQRSVLQQFISTVS